MNNERKISLEAITVIEHENDKWNQHACDVWIGIHTRIRQELSRTVGNDTLEAVRTES